MKNFNSFIYRFYVVMAIVFLIMLSSVGKAQQMQYVVPDTVDYYGMKAIRIVREYCVTDELETLVVFLVPPENVEQFPKRGPVPFCYLVRIARFQYSVNPLRAIQKVNVSQLDTDWLEFNRWFHGEYFKEEDDY